MFDECLFILRLPHQLLQETVKTPPHGQTVFTIFPDPTVCAIFIYIVNPYIKFQTSFLLKIEERPNEKFFLLKTGSTFFEFFVFFAFFSVFDRFNVLLYKVILGK